MKRFASHYIISGNEIYLNHYIELDEQNQMEGIFPFREEKERISFYNGILVPIPFQPHHPFEIPAFLNQFCREIIPENIGRIAKSRIPALLPGPVSLFQIDKTYGENIKTESKKPNETNKLNPPEYHIKKII